MNYEAIFITPPEDPLVKKTPTTKNFTKPLQIIILFII